MAILQGARITGSIIATQFIKASGFSGSLTASRLYVQGSVGIGTTNPNYKFEIGAGTSNVVVAKLTQGYERVRYYGFDLLGYNDGNLWMIGNNATNGLILGSNWDWDAQAGIYYTPGTYGAAGGSLEIGQLTKNNANYTHGNTRFYTNGTERMRITSTGNVGIGTTTVSEKLSVEGSIILAASDATSLDSGRKIRFYRNADGWEPAQIEQIWTGGGYQGILAFKTNTGALGTLTTKMVINNNGNVGIGTTGPSTKLHIQSGSILVKGATTPGLNLEPSGAVGNADISFNGTSFILVSNSNSADLRLSTNSTPRLTILAGGNVGIGTTSPLYRLQLGNLTSTSTATPEILSLGGTFSNSAGSNVKLRVYDDAGSAVGGMSVSSGQMEVNTWSSGKIAFYRGTTQSAIIDANGNVGIGTSSPGAKLQVNGTALATTVTDGSISLNGGDLLFAADGGGNGFQFDYYNTKMYIGNNAGSTWYMGIQDDGNVGIGTTSPGAKFVVNNNGGTGNAFYVDVGNRNDVTTLFEHTGTTTPVPFRLKKSGYSGTAANYGLLYLHMNDGTVGNGSNLYFTLNDSVGNEHEYGGLGTHVITNTNGAESGDLVFYTSDAGTIRSEKVRIKFNGNVGIGTTSPKSKLEVAGSSGTALVSIVNTTNSRSGSFGIDGNGAYIRNSNNGDYFDLKNASGTARFRVVYDNNIFLNTTFTSVGSLTQSGSKLSVFGNTSVGSSYGSIAAPSNGLIVQGNVGIGTSSPGVKLVILGETQISSNSAYTTHLNYNDAGTNFITTANTGYTYFRGSSNGVTTMAVYGGGGVSVGTSTLESGCILTVQASNSARMSVTDGTTRAHFWPTGGAFYISTETNSPMVFITNAGERMRILANGNVGIGTSSPLNKLSVISSNSTSYYNRTDPVATFQGVSPSTVLISVDGNVNGYYAELKLGNAQSTYYPYSAYIRGIQGSGIDYYRLEFGTAAGSAATTRMTIANDGNVGIGTTSPTTKLDIASTQANGIVMRYDTTTAYQSWIRPYWNSDTDTRIDFAINRSANVTPAVIMSVGYGSNVGIGTTAPAAKLDVVSGSIRAASGAYAGEINFGTAAGDNTNIYLKRDNNYDLSLVQNAASGNALYLAGAGNVYVSIDSNNNETDRAFAYKLDVNGSINASTFMYVTYPYGDAYPLQLIGSSFLKANNNYYGLLIRSGDTNFISGRLSLIGGSSKRFEIHGYEETVGYIPTVIPGGNVGIGTTNPTYKLEVAGTLKTTSTITNDGGIYYGGG